MIEARLADGTVLRFPEGTNQDVIDRTVKKHIQSSNMTKSAALWLKSLRRHGTSCAWKDRGITVAGLNLSLHERPIELVVTEAQEPRCVLDELILQDGQRLLLSLHHPRLHNVAASENAKFMCPAVRSSGRCRLHLG